MQQWEYWTDTYRTERFQNYIPQEYLNGYGVDGWELVGINSLGHDSEYNYTYLLIFKRPKHEQLSREPYRSGDQTEVQRMGESQLGVPGKEQGFQDSRGNEDIRDGEEGENSSLRDVETDSE